MLPLFIQAVPQWGFSSRITSRVPPHKPAVLFITSWLLCWKLLLAELYFGTKTCQRHDTLCSRRRAPNKVEEADCSSLLFEKQLQSLVEQTNSALYIIREIIFVFYILCITYYTGISYEYVNSAVMLQQTGRCYPSTYIPLVLFCLLVHFSIRMGIKINFNRLRIQLSVDAPGPIHLIYS